MKISEVTKSARIALNGERERFEGKSNQKFYSVYPEDYSFLGLIKALPCVFETDL